MRRNLFYTLFPPPKFLQMPAIGLDISDEAIRFVELIETRQGFEVGVFGERALPKESIQSGKIVNTAGVKKVISKLAKDFNFNFARVSLPEEKAYVVRLEIPKMEHSEIRDNLELQLEEQVPIPVQEAVFDYSIINSDRKDGKMEVSLCVLPDETVMQYLSIFDGTDITPVAFEIESQSISRAVVPKGEEETVMIIDLEGSKTGISIVGGGAVLFTSSVNVGGNMITKAIAEGLSVSVKEAEKIKKEKGFLQDKEHQTLALSLVPTLATLRDEVNKHYEYWHTHMDQYAKSRPEIGKIFLCGEDATIPGLADYLASGIKAQIIIANPMSNIISLDEYIPDMKFKESLKYVTALGLAMLRAE